MNYEHGSVGFLSPQLTLFRINEVAQRFYHCNYQHSARKFSVCG